MVAVARCRAVLQRQESAGEAVGQVGHTEVERVELEPMNNIVCLLVRMVGGRRSIPPSVLR